MNTNSPPGTSVYNETGLQELGFRIYWYPVLAGWRLRRRRPKAIKVLGEDVVLFRDRNQIGPMRAPWRTFI